MNKKYIIRFNGKDIATEGNKQLAISMAELKYQLSTAKKKVAEVIQRKTGSRVFAQYNLTVTDKS
jgi:hypothetical protein